MNLHQVTLSTDRGSVVLSFPVTPALLQQIQHEAIFHFDVGMFANALPTSFAHGTLQIIGPDKGALDVAENGETHLDDVDWQVLDLTADGVVYPTFISLRRDGKLTGSLLSSMRDFAVGKAGSREMPTRAKTALERALDRIVSIARSPHVEKSAESELPSVIRSYAQEVPIEPISPELRERISATFGALHLDTIESNGGFSFASTLSGVRWESVLSVSPETSDAELVSGTPVDVDSTSLSTLLSELQQINDTLTQRRFEYNVSAGRLQLRSEIDVACLADDSLLRDRIKSHLEGMQAIVPVLQQRYGKGIVFRGTE